MAEHVADLEAVTDGVQDLQAANPASYGYACTSGSFVNGRAGEAHLVEAMRAAGAPAAVTTSGALLSALAQGGATRVSVATPYDAAVTARLEAFLDEAGIQVAGRAHLGLETGIASVPYARTAQLVMAADDDTADAVVVSCTNLPTYDLIAPMERLLGKPVITANEATMWAVLATVGRRPVGPGQHPVEALVSRT
ncbi:MAG: maleate cis-trans isomerase family protein, partial [Jatrophihabitantaceae bacterium]